MYLLPEKKGNPEWPLPASYGSAKRSARRDMRLELLTGWYRTDDRGVPLGGELIGDREVFLAALAFFVDFYFKQSDVFRHEYYLPDSVYKPQYWEMFTHPRSVFHAPRHVCKSFAVVFELIPFLAVTRRNTAVLLGSETEQLTKEKIKKVRRRIEQNGRIYSDFGQVHPMGRSAAYDWSNTTLDFVGHAEGSQVQGSSVDASTRGRHPIAGIIDDPEGKRSKKKKWRDNWMHWLFHDYLNQFSDRGTNVMWVGTILGQDSCLQRAINNDDSENRFVAWERKRLPLIYEDPPDSGEMVSAWPEFISVDEFERKKHGQSDEDGSVTPIGLVAAMAEFQGEPIPSGSLMFKRDRRRHGFVLTQDNDGRRVIYYPYERRMIDLESLMQDSFRYAAVDLADNDGDGDRAAIVVAIFDADGVLWFVDAWDKACFAEEASAEALRMSNEWTVSRLGWDAATIGRRVYREARLARGKRMEDGFHVPVYQPIPSEGIEKSCRIERMIPDFQTGRIRFPLLTPIDGIEPLRHPHARSIRELIDQFDTMTGDGTMGYDDLIDATEMLHRMAARRPKRYVRPNDSQRLIEKWVRKGIEVNPMHVPPAAWTPAMHREFAARVTPSMAEESVCDAFV